MDGSSNLLPSLAMVDWTMRASGTWYLASRRNRCLRGVETSKVRVIVAG